MSAKSKSAKRVVVTVRLAHMAAGHVGPCADDTCNKVAARIYDVWLNDTHMRTWTCDDHGKELESGADV